MGDRWVYEKQERNDNGYGDIYIGDSRAHRHDDYVRIHNADRDAYEARIAELWRALLASAEETRRAFNEALSVGLELKDAQAELARVKAESLRVVDLPQAYKFASDWYMTPDGLGWNSSDRHGDSCVETPEGYHQFADCKKVRLERWETEE